MKPGKFINGNSYYNPQLGFYIEKPDNWSFIPREWTINMKKMALENNPQWKEKLSQAAMPFLSFHLFHNDSRFAYPSVNCSCRLIISGSRFNPKEFLKLNLSFLDSMYENFNVIQAFDDFIISGYQGIFIKATHDVYNSEDILIRTVNRIISIYRPINREAIMYNIGLNGNYEGEYCCEEDFENIIKSIAIG